MQIPGAQTAAAAWFWGWGAGVHTDAPGVPGTPRGPSSGEGAREVPTTPVASPSTDQLLPSSSQPFPEPEAGDEPRVA